MAAASTRLANSICCFRIQVSSHHRDPDSAISGHLSGLRQAETLIFHDGPGQGTGIGDESIQGIFEKSDVEVVAERFPTNTRKPSCFSRAFVSRSTAPTRTWTEKVSPSATTISASVAPQAFAEPRHRQPAEHSSPFIVSESRVSEASRRFVNGPFTDHLACDRDGYPLLVGGLYPCVPPTVISSI